MSRHVEKPWGHEEIWAETEAYVGKILTIREGHRLSMQYHRTKEETIRVMQGTLQLQTGAPRPHGSGVVQRLMGPGEVYHVRPGTVHRFAAASGDVTLLEVSTNHLDDVVRIEDDYARAGGPDA